jgi:hypothetical protein
MNATTTEPTVNAVILMKSGLTAATNAKKNAMHATLTWTKTLLVPKYVKKFASAAPDTFETCPTTAASPNPTATMIAAKRMKNGTMKAIIAGNNTVVKMEQLQLLPLMEQPPTTVTLNVMFNEFNKTIQSVFANTVLSETAKENVSASMNATTTVPTNNVDCPMKSGTTAATDVKKKSMHAVPTWLPIPSVLNPARLTAHACQDSFETWLTINVSQLQTATMINAVITKDGTMQRINVGNNTVIQVLPQSQVVLLPDPMLLIQTVIQTIKMRQVQCVSVIMDSSEAQLVTVLLSMNVTTMVPTVNVVDQMNNGTNVVNTAKRLTVATQLMMLQLPLFDHI